jgi:uncharacterized protein YecT (DUF1311 family)
MKRSIAMTAVALCVTVLSIPARADLADDKRLSSAFHLCMEHAGSATAAMHACMASEQARLEDALNAVYRDLMSAMPDGDEKKTLRDAERAWISHRETQCAFEGTQQEGGTLKPVLIAGCWLRETADRIETLQQRRDFEKRR